jgi:sterol 3beta-glucosyltransferase
MKIVLTSFGSTGDIQPFLGLAKHLRDHGHETLFASSPQFKPMFDRIGAPFVAIGPDLAEAHRDFLQRELQGPMNIRQANIIVKPFLDALPQIIQELQDICRDAAVLVGAADTAPHALIVHEQMQIPYVSILPGYIDGRIVFGHKQLAQFLNPFRAQLGLPPIPFHDPLSMVASSPQLALYALSRYILPPDSAWPEHYHVTGFFFVDEEHWQPDPGLVAFLTAGDPPVVISFGSMIHEDPTAVTQLLVTAIRRVGCRAIIQRGWSGLAQQPNLPSHIHMTGYVPHAWLFARAACVVHHGGAGTAAATLRAGVPAICVPHFFDQFSFSDAARSLGCVSAVIPYAKLTVERLCVAIAETLTNPRYRRAAETMSQRIGAEQGVETARTLIERMVTPSAPVAERPSDRHLNRHPPSGIAASAPPNAMPGMTE